MKFTIKPIVEFFGKVFNRTPGSISTAGERVNRTSAGVIHQIVGNRWLIVGILLAGTVSYVLHRNPPMKTIDSGEVGIRINQITGTSTEWREGGVLVVPLIHDLRRFSLRDQIYRAGTKDGEQGLATFQSSEGLSVGVDLAVRYALDPAKITSVARSLPESIGAEVIEPSVEGVIYKVFTRYTVREIFSTKRALIQQQIEEELKPKLAADGIVLRAVQVGRIELPAQFKAGMERLLAEELASEKMKFTLEIKEKQVKESALQADADKVRRETAAEAAAREQVIAAKAQEEAMKHVLPFKQKQIEQRQFEAEASRVAQVKAAEGASQARRIEASAEAESRQKLAEAEAYRLDRVGKATADQMAREGALITKHPLLIQKTLADKLSDKISVIIAPPPSNGDFIGAALLGKTAVASKSQYPSGDEDPAPQSKTEARR
ncbi:MAG: prohibitin family protein [Burkholderiales bacterium]|nr:MAG: prohibitin family protein [Betaproteobacteria bacterium]TAG24518.1 MAG: prohibitin family protein [Burkholderiales bacterium]